MRYEHISVDLSTAACSALQTMIECSLGFHDEASPTVKQELVNLANELGARLQRTDQDPNVEQKDWLEL
jgi:hypothetical protein